MNVLKKEVVERDKLVVFNEDGTADIATVFDRDDNAIYAESPTLDYAVPIGDLKSFVSSFGRIYTLKADFDYIQDTVRLAALEKSIVLRHVTQFEKAAPENNGLNIKQIMLYVLIGVLLLGVIFK